MPSKASPTFTSLSVYALAVSKNRMPPSYASRRSFTATSVVSRWMGRHPNAFCGTTISVRPSLTSFMLTPSYV